jgi:hypothetical protein
LSGEKNAQWSFIMTGNATIENEKPAAKWRLGLGLAIFVIGFSSPLLIPLVTASDLSTK